MTDTSMCVNDRYMLSLPRPTGQVSRDRRKWRERARGEKKKREKERKKESEREREKERERERKRERGGGGGKGDEGGWVGEGGGGQSGRRRVCMRESRCGRESVFMICLSLTYSHTLGSICV